MVHEHFRRAWSRHHGFEGRFRHGWGRRARRGAVPLFVLEALADGPKHGYEILGAIEKRRGNRPSPGSIYPTLEMLEEAGFISGDDVDGKRVFTITDAGRAHLAERAGGLDDEEPDPHHDLKNAAMKLGAAVMSARGSDEATLANIRAVLDRARKEVYAILAADET